MNPVPRVTGPVLELPGADRLVRALFDEAAERTGTVSRTYEIARLPVRMLFAGTEMLDRIGDSFAHLAADQTSRERELTIHIWDSASTATPEPPTAGSALGGNDGTGPIYYYEHDGVQAINRWRTLSVLDSRTGEAWFWAPASRRMLSWDWASPLRAILHWWLGLHGVLQVHGGAVGIDGGGGALIVGRGGSGKSTTSLACLSAGLLYAGDDFVGLQRRPVPYVHSLYGSGKLETHQIERFPHLLPAVANAERLPEEKAVLYAANAPSGALTAGFPLRAVLVPKVVALEPETRAVPVSPATALAALAPSTIFQLHPPQQNGLAEMAALVRDVPCYTLELGSDIGAIPAAVVAVLDRETT